MAKHFPSHERNSPLEPPSISCHQILHSNSIDRPNTKPQPILAGGRAWLVQECDLLQQEQFAGCDEIARLNAIEIHSRSKAGILQSHVVVARLLLLVHK